jgi:hypothetical protein
MTRAQIVLAITTFAVLAAYPPAEGFLLLVPLTVSAERDTPAIALGGGATLVARGPFRGSLIVHGRRDRLAVPAGLLVLAAPAAICGSGSVSA